MGPAADERPPTNALVGDGSPAEDVAPVVLFLACNDAQFLTGYSLTQDSARSSPARADQQWRAGRV
jgi:3-oxoacyl-[acyl-carrier protein] reductase